MKITYILLLLSILPIYSQDGVIRYGEIQSMGMGAPIGSDYNAVLYFNAEKSLYITRKDSLEGGHINRYDTYQADENRVYMKNFVTNPEGFQYYNDLKNKLFYSRDIGFRYVKEETPKINWSIEKETKIIGGYECQKATAHFRGRNYTAWFTTKIPVPYGPWKLHGLPGAILEAYDTHKEIYWYFKSLEYPTDCSSALKPVVSQNWISFEDYKHVLIENWKKSKIMGRMAVESIGASSLEDQNIKQTTLDSYIEGFEFE